MPIEWIAHGAPAAGCLAADGNLRGMGSRIAFASATPDRALMNRASAVRRDDGTAGRVQSCGDWRDATVHARLAEALDGLSSFLRPGFEWYRCRGAFFHNDAHYDSRMFGIWYITGPDVDVVFPRASVRLSATVGTVVIFDPFEVHGVLAAGRLAYSADDYQQREASLFLGFEIDLTAEVATAFGIEPGAVGPIISSATRICAVSGAING